MKTAYWIVYLLVFITWSARAQENVALGKPVAVSSEAPGFSAANMVDGKVSRHSVWHAASNKAPHIIEIDLQKYYSITELRVHSGILDAEKHADEMTQAAGFWSIKNFKLQYWDDANWSDFPKSEVHENRLVSAIFKYDPAITTFRIRLVCDDGEAISIMEVEAIGTETPNMPPPPTVQSTIVQQSRATGPQSATITVSNKVVGKTMKYVGYNQGYYMPGSNVSKWVEYSDVNSFRVWASLNAFVPESAVQVDPQLHSVEEFDKRKNELRSNPEHNRFIKWESLLPLYDRADTSSTNGMVFNYALSELKRMNIDVILQITSTDFKDNWENKWKQWQRYYTLAYYAAKKGHVSMFAMTNEPNHRHAGPMKLEQWIVGMQIVSDAVHAAVDDVNKKYGTQLKGRFVGPVTAGQNTEWWAAIARAIRTDYHGKTIDKDLIDIFSTHSYNSPASGYAARIDNIRKILVDNHPLHRPLPIVYTEIGRWMNAYLIDKEETMDSPSLFTEWAGIYANNMKNGGYGMWAFKFANTTSGTYPRGIKSGHHFIWQGKRIIEEAYRNLALGKADRPQVTDGDKSDASAWIADSTVNIKTVEINLSQPSTLGSAVVYTGSDGGVYTAPDRVRSFRLQYINGDSWKDIPGAVENNNKYAQVIIEFKQPVTTSRVRFVSEDKGLVKVREIKLFAAGDGPSGEPCFDVSGIQRTGEVVRLFAKGFKDERPLMETKASVSDAGLDAYTSFDAQSGNYYMWLVQRGQFEYDLTLDLYGLGVPAGSVITAEEVGPEQYGEVTAVHVLGANRKWQYKLKAQSVVLLTISKAALKRRVIAGRAKQPIVVQADVAARQYKTGTIQFTVPAQNPQRVLLKVNGTTDKMKAPYRLHVYASELNNDPIIDKDGFVKGAAVAGEWAFTGTKGAHYLDVTTIVRKFKGKPIRFILAREVRQLGDDGDKGYSVIAARPQLLWYTR
jgi:F5/8 type C domain.